MSNKEQFPDRADSPAGEGIDVPTYHDNSPQDATTQFPENSPPSDRNDIYERAGRVSPQEIPAGTYKDQDFAPTGGSTAYEQSPQVPVVAAASATSDSVGVDPTSPALPEHRRGTIDFGLLLIRVLLGGWLIIAAVATFFRLGGSDGISGLEAEFSGYLAPAGLAVLIPALQLAAGVFLVLGLITPLFAMVATVVTSFTALHALAGTGAGLNLFAWSGDVWLSIVLFGISLALQFTGPGLYSFDFGRSWARRPLVSTWIFVVLAIVGGGALWWFGAGISPLN